MIKKRAREVLTEPPFTVSTFIRKGIPVKDRDLYRKVLNIIFETIKEILIEKERIWIKYLGEFYYTRFKNRKKIVDHGVTRTIDNVAYYTNFHSQRMTYKMIWKHSIHRLLFFLEPSRHLNRGLAKKLKN